MIYEIRLIIGGRNAAILACQIISLYNDNVRRQTHELKISLSEKVTNKQRILNQHPS